MDRTPSTSGDASASRDVFTGLVFYVEFNPLPSIGVDGSSDELVLLHITKAVTLPRLEDDTWRSDELTYDDSLRAVDDKGPLIGHFGEITHEDCLLFDFAGVSVHEPSSNENLIRVCVIFFFAFLFGKLGRSFEVLVFTVELKLEFEVSGEIGYRTDIGKGFCHTEREKAVEGFFLDVN